MSREKLKVAESAILRQTDSDFSEKNKGDGAVDRRLFIKNRHLLLGTMLVMCISLAKADMITIVNPGFGPGSGGNTTSGEVLSKNSHTGTLPNGWDIYNPQDVRHFYETYTPSGNALSEFSNTSTTSGNVLFLDMNYSGGGQGPNGTIPRPFGFEQELGVGVQAGTYTFEAAVGNPKETEYTDGSTNYVYSGFGGYGLELFARVYDPADPTSFVESILLGSMTSPGIAEGVFDTVSLTATVESSSPLIDAILGIRLFSENNALEESDGTPITALSGIAFDNVTLNLSPVPVPAAVWLFGSALAGLAGFSRRRKQAVLKSAA